MGLEGLESIFTLLLCAVAMDTGAAEASMVQEIVQSVCTALGLHKDERQSVLPGDAEQVEKAGPFVLLLHPHDLLRDVLAGGAHAAHCQEDVVVEEVPGQHLQHSQGVAVRGKSRVTSSLSSGPAPTCISLGKVAENMRVCRWPTGGMVSCSTMRRIWGSKPMSSIRSASSSTRNLGGGEMHEMAA